MQDARKRDPESILLAVIAGAVLIRISAFSVFPSIHHPDEIFQVLEPAHRLLTGDSVVTWEWREGIRSWFLPGVVFLVMRAATLFSTNPGIYLALIHALVASWSTLIVYLAYQTGGQHGGRLGAVGAACACALWPDLVFFAPKTLTEVFAAPLILAAAYLAQVTKGRPSASLFLIGLLLGACFCIRFHLSPALLIIAAWASGSDIRKRWLPLLVGASIPLLASGLLDFATLGTPWQSIWKNLWINIVEKKSEVFGVSGPLFLVAATARTWGIIGSPLLLILFMAGLRKLPLFAICGAVIWMAFSLIPHKELRFIYPATPFILITAGIGSALVVEKLWAMFGWRRWQGESIVFAWMMLALVPVLSMQTRSMWLSGSDTLAAQQRLVAQQDMCGLAISSVPWFSMGGYSHLHKQVPIYLLRQSDWAQDQEPTEAYEAFNFAMSPSGQPLPPPFRVPTCDGQICIQKRAGVCVPNNDLEINQLLRVNGR